MSAPRQPGRRPHGSETPHRHGFVAASPQRWFTSALSLVILLAGVAGCSSDAPIPRFAPNPTSTSVLPDPGGGTTPPEAIPPETAAAESEAPEPVSPAPSPVDVTSVLLSNALYGSAPLQGAGCSGDSSVPLDSLDNVTAYYTSVLTCLDAAWTQVGATAGIDVRPAGLEVFSGPSFGSCFDGVEYSFYCSSTETMYMYADEIIRPWVEYPADYSHGLTRLAATHVIAHEYGHHVQQVTGILTAVGPDIAGTEMERRLELQASCLANIFLASQADAYPIEADYLAQPELWRFITRVPNHGSEANQALWTERGYQTATPGDCNTFGASPEDVV